MVEQLYSNFQIKYLILEKVLTQPIIDLDKLAKSTLKLKGVFVNPPRRLYGKLKPALSESVFKKMKVIGRFGLVCNAIHSTDLFDCLANETIVTIDNSGLDKFWIESKRKSFLEVFGTSVINYSNGSVLIIVSKAGNMSFQMSLLDDNREWIIDEDNGLLTSADLTISTENSP